MKYTLETIPVWDAVEDTSADCIFCTLMEAAELRSITYYLGSSVMNPETRVKVNSRGFCPDHYRALMQAAKPQAMALISHTHLMQTQKELRPLLAALQGTKRTAKSRKLIMQIRKMIRDREQGCLICDSMQETLNRYLYTFVFLWGENPEFREAVSRSNGICIHHLPSVLDMALEVLSGEVCADLFGAISEHMERWITQSVEDVHWMTQMYKSENRDKSWRGCEEAQKRAVRREIGSGRIIRNP